jgi:hypothetical protein
MVEMASGDRAPLPDLAYLTDENNGFDLHPSIRKQNGRGYSK